MISSCVAKRKKQPVLFVTAGPPRKGVTASSLEWLPGSWDFYSKSLLPTAYTAPRKRTSALHKLTVIQPLFLKSLAIAE